MSRILIHSNAPWVPTGYGLQTRNLVKGLKDLGHEVAVSAFAGLGGADVTWDDTLVMPGGQMGFGVDVIIPHMERYNPDLTITLMDLWKLEALGASLRRYNVAAWLPVDCTPMSRRDLNTLIMSQVKPIAMSQFGLRQINNEMFKGVKDLQGESQFPAPHYAPHMIDMASDFTIMPDRDVWRSELGLADNFVVGICAANKDTIRKAFPEQFYAFSLLRKKVPNAVLLVHSTVRNVSGLDLGRLAESFDIAEHVRFTDQYDQDAGLFSVEMMRRWYNALDVLMLCSYGEGFGVPAIEAQACGTPVVASNNSALSELTDVRDQVQCDNFWNFIHEAWWARPRPESIVRRLLNAHNRVSSHKPADIMDMYNRNDVRANVIEYDTVNVMKRWASIVEDLT
jgi:glycosyltransferase involved in cell wall biosynthesis